MSRAVDRWTTSRVSRGSDCRRRLVRNHRHTGCRHANGLEFDGRKGKSEGENLALFGLPFITGMDVYIPAITPPNHPVRITSTSRTAPDQQVTVNVPNWPSSDHHVSVQLWDFDRR